MNTLVSRLDLTTAPLYEFPDLIHDLIQKIGTPAALAIVERYRGIRLFVPVHARQITPEHPLARCIGVELACKLVKEYAGMELPIPRCVAAIRALRDRDIRARHTVDGWPAWRLAQANYLTERQVYTILAARDDDQEDPQAALF